ncbi:MAG: M17 family peptidase N-terminal domain-containing protein [Pseudolysinimonas sp.]
MVELVKSADDVSGLRVVGAFEGADARPDAGLGATALGVDVGALGDPTFTGAAGQQLRTVVDGKPVVVIGLGARPTLSRDALRDAAMAAPAGAVVSLLAAELPSDDRALAAVTEGHRLGAWRYGEQQQAALSIVWQGESAAAERAETVATATNWVRQLVETPPNLLGPREFADRILAFAQPVAGVTASVWDAATLAERGFGGTLAVGAARPGTALVVELTVDGPDVVALAGKGITFDSGGINLKRDATEIAWMKSDMAAAASVAAAVITAASLGAARGIHAILPITENMPGALAQRPGDVVTHPGGRTTEVVDTDCEGRLVLADALAWLAMTEPTALIDVGTLTDSGALGTAYWGCWSNSTSLAADVVSAGERAGDPGWQLPLHPSYLALLSSRVADIANAPGEAPDTGVVAATFLREFVGDVAWLHIDNGSGAYLEHDAGAWPVGPTGTPVRALVEYLCHSIY